MPILAVEEDFGDGNGSDLVTANHHMMTWHHIGCFGESDWYQARFRL